MRGSKVAALSAVTLFSTLLGWSSAVPAAAGPGISYGGRGVAITETTSGVTTRVTDTGELPSSGGTIDASALSGVTSGVSATTLHASSIGQGDRTRSEASVASVSLIVGLHSLAADFAMSRTEAVKHGGNVTLSGKSHIDSLVLDGLPVPVTGQPNQAVPLPDGLLVINEQTTSASGGIQSISVNAMHLTLGDVDILLGTSRAGVSTGSNSCASSADFMTAGGWVAPPGGVKRSFGLIGGIRANGTPHGHLVFVNHQTNERLRGMITTYTRADTTSIMRGEGDADGQPAEFVLSVTDNGEPGSADEFNLEFITPPRAPEGGTLGGGNVQTHDVCG